MWAAAREVLVNGCVKVFAAGSPALNVMCYVYIGGTTKHSKCVVVTHSIAFWEVKHYAEAFKDSVTWSDRCLQYSSVYWSAAVFGQLDVALAFGACAVLVPTLPDMEWIATACLRHSINVLGIVPSELRGTWPGGVLTKRSCLRVLPSWAEKLPLALASEWRPHVTLFELFITS